MGWILGRGAAMACAMLAAAAASAQAPQPAAAGDCDLALRAPAATGAVPALALPSVRQRACECLKTAQAADAGSVADGSGTLLQYSATVSRCVGAAVIAEPIPVLPARTLHALSMAANPPPPRAEPLPSRAPPRPSLKSGSTCKQPEYPVAAARSGTTGTTRPVFHIGLNGDVIDADILKSSGKTLHHKLLDMAALMSLMQCVFSPAVVNGVAVEATTQVEYVWRLE
jgi:TonB family protein